MRSGGGGVERARVEVVEDAADKAEGMAVDQLLVFIAGTFPTQRFRSNASAVLQPPFVPSLSGFEAAPTRFSTLSEDGRAGRRIADKPGIGRAKADVSTSAGKRVPADR